MFLPIRRRIKKTKRQTQRDFTALVLVSQFSITWLKVPFHRHEHVRSGSVCSLAALEVSWMCCPTYEHNVNKNTKNNKSVCVTICTSSLLNYFPKTKNRELPSSTFFEVFAYNLLKK